MVTRVDRPRYAKLRVIVSRLFIFAAGLLMAVSAYLFRWEIPNEFVLEATLLMLLGGLCVFLGLLVRPSSARQSLVQPAPSTDGGINARWLIPGLLTFALLVESNGSLLHIDLLAHLSLGVQLILFVVFIGCITAALAGYRFSRPHWERGSFPSLKWFGSTPFLLFLLTLMAFVVREWQLGTAVHRFIDEFHFANAVTALRISTQDFKLLAPFSSITAFPWLFPYIQSWFVTLGGRNLESLRFLSVILGCLGVPAVYLLGKVLFDRKTALIAALLLATFPPHVQFSRIGLNNIADPLFGTLMLAFLIRGLKTNRRMDFALAGAMLGLTQYFYEGGRFLYPALALLWIAWHLLLTRFQRPADSHSTVPKTEPSLRAVSQSRFSLNPRFSGLRTFFLTAVLISLPLYITLLALHQSLNQRFEIVGLGGSYWLRVQQIGALQTPEEQFFSPLLIYVHLPETAQYFGGEQALMLPAVVMFFLFGVFVLIWRWRSPGFILPLWVLLTSLGNVLLTDSAISARYVVAFPALMLIAAVGLRSLPALLFATQSKPSPDRSRLRRWMSAVSPSAHYSALSALLAIVLAVAQVTYYFGPHLQSYNRQLRPYSDAEDAVFRGATLPYGTMVHIIANPVPSTTYLSALLNYLADGITIESLTPDKVSRPYLASMPGGLHHAFFIQREDAYTLAYLRDAFGDALQGPFNSPFEVDPAKQLVLYYLPGQPQG